MTSSPEMLRFFATEALEYLDALEDIVTSNSGEPDGGAVVAVARAMRGSATMARVPHISEMAFILEQIGNSLREGELSWTVALQEAMHAAAKDLRLLISAAGRWTAQDDQRALQRLAALRHYTPDETARPTPASPASTAAPIFIALQAAAIAGDLEAFVADSRGRTLLDDVVNRLRSLRGIAGVADHPPLGDVADAVERSLRGLSPDALLADSDAELFRAAAAVFRRASADLRARGRINLASGEIARFAQATAPREKGEPEAERIVRIDDLFYADAGPHVVQRGTRGSVTPDVRFRSGSVTRAEHLRRLVADARDVADPISRDRVGHDLRLNLERVEQLARSFNAQQIASFFADLALRVHTLDAALLDAIDSGAQVLLVPNASIEDMEQRLALLDRARHTTPGAARMAPLMPPPTTRSGSPSAPPSGSPSAPPSGSPSAPPSGSPSAPPSGSPSAPLSGSPSAPPSGSPSAPLSGSPSGSPPPSPPRAARPSIPLGATAAPRKAPPAPAAGKALHDLLQQGLAGLESLDFQPLSEPARVDEESIVLEDGVVPIEALLYRGRAALQRAIELRDAMRTKGLSDEESLSELYDLLDLARSE